MVLISFVKWTSLHLPVEKEARYLLEEGMDSDTSGRGGWLPVILEHYLLGAEGDRHSPTALSSGKVQRQQMGEMRRKWQIWAPVVAGVPSGKGGWNLGQQPHPILAVRQESKDWEVPQCVWGMSNTQILPMKEGLENPMVPHPNGRDLSSRHRGGQGGKAWVKPRDPERVPGYRIRSEETCCSNPPSSCAIWGQSWASSLKITKTFDPGIPGPNTNRYTHVETACTYVHCSMWTGVQTLKYR